MLLKKEWKNTICSNMDEPRDYHKSEEKKNDITYMWYHIYVISLIPYDYHLCEI